MDRLQEYYELRQAIESHHYDWMLEIQTYEEASARAKELGNELDSRRENVALINADLRMMVEGKNEGERQADLTRRQSADPDHQEARSAELEVQADLDATRLVIDTASQRASLDRYMLRARTAQLDVLATLPQVEIVIKEEVAADPVEIMHEIIQRGQRQSFDGVPDTLESGSIIITKKARKQ